MAPHKSPHKRDKTKASPAAPAVQARRLSSDTPQQVSATSSATSSAASSRVLTATPKSKSKVSALRNDDDGGDDFFSPYKPPSRTASYRRAPGDDPAAKRRPKSCVMRAPLTSPEQTFARNEPTDALHSLRLASRLERGMNHISPQQLAALITGKHDEHYDRIIVIDARFDYEYNGGHVRGAVSTLIIVFSLSLTKVLFAINLLFFPLDSHCRLCNTRSITRAFASQSTRRRRRTHLHCISL